MKERKWWCFLLSSILTFLMGVTGVFVMRVLKFVFCREVVIVVNMTPLKLYLQSEEDEYFDRRQLQDPKEVDFDNE